MTAQNASEPIGFSLVIPVLNEAAVLPALFERLDDLIVTLDAPVEVIFVDDGSTDETKSLIRTRAAADSRFRLIQLSRNFGHQAAITAGMDLAEGRAVIVMDADLQDPPEVVLEMIAKWRDGFQIVYAERTSRAGESRFKRWTAHLFYKALRRIAAVDIPANVGDFRLVDRQVILAFRQMRERDRYVRGMFAWLGFRQAAVRFERPGRAAGETKYPFFKMVRLGVNGLVSFSDAPLQLALWIGLFVSLGALGYGLYVVIAALIGGHGLVPGWASTMVVVSFLCGLNMMLTGVVGLYVGRIHSEVKARPLYVVDAPETAGQAVVAAKPESAAAPPQAAGRATPAPEALGRATTAPAAQPVFDAYGTSYRGIVQDSVAFSGLDYSFFVRSKAGLLANLFAEHLPDRPAPTVLDVGCGVGALHPLLAPHCGELHGADISSACIEQATRDNPGVTYKAYQGLALPYPDAYFDAVVAICVLHHVPPADWAAFTAELRRVLKPRGLVCVIEHNPFNPATRLSVMRCPFDEDAVLAPRRKTCGLLSEAGFNDVQGRYFVFTPWTAPWARRLERALAPVPLGAQYLAFGRA
ncbi:glycosyltransferase [Phenylobacterium montanum]|uniref:Glycosyltransferase n=1 Tax=Phenylobacterium montanum TaxID=2823693 RepID=A0A975G0R3_9CAUL|nr:glycosyltransferase [Caulobacter sp. S6]QUD88479.1 glycosyltransferase [Caulobacter sp. S6]